MNYPMPPVDFSKLEEDALGSVKEELAESTVAEILKQGISLGMLLGKSYKKKVEDDEEEDESEEDEAEEYDEEEEEEEGCPHQSEKKDLIAMLLGRREQGMFPMKPKGYQDSMEGSKMIDVGALHKERKAMPALVISITPAGKKRNGLFG